jgi:uncharacterized lipoprotein YmbA
MGRIAFPVAVSILIAIVTGCGSTPPSHFYTLDATAKAAAVSSNVSVSVGPVTVPAVVDRPQIVVRTGPNEVWLDEFNRWAAPLDDNFGRAVAENLVAMLGTPHVTVFPQTDAVNAQYRVAIQVQTFESAPGQAATLDAAWTVRGPKDARSQTGRTSVREPVQGGTGYPALMAAHSRAVARVSQDIADAIRALESGAGGAVQSR